MPHFFARLAWLAAGFAACAQTGEADRAFERALALHRAGDMEAAIGAYRASLAADPARVDARSNLGAALARLGRYEEAIGEYRKALDRARPAARIPLRMNLALAYYKSFQIPEAAAELSAILASEPGNLHATLLLADCNLRLGQYRRVIDSLQPLEASQPEDRAVAYLLGMALLREGRLAESQRRLDKLLGAGDSAQGQFLLGASMFFARDYPGAVKALARAAALDPSLPSVQSFYGQALLETGDADAASEAFRAELAANPNDYESNLRLGEILAHRGRFDDARPLLEKALQVRPAAREAALALARARERKPDPQTVAGNGEGGIPVGAPAPAFDLLGHFGGKAALLVFGSYSCPNFRSGAAALNALYRKHGARVRFLLVYIREAHAGAEWQSTINERQGVAMDAARDLAEKREHASLCVRKLNLEFPAAVDGTDGAVESAYDAWPSRVYLVAPDGRVAFNSRLGELDFRAADLEAALLRMPAP